MVCQNIIRGNATHPHDTYSISEHATFLQKITWLGYHLSARKAILMSAIPSFVSPRCLGMSTCYCLKWNHIPSSEITYGQEYCEPYLQVVQEHAEAERLCRSDGFNRLINSCQEYPNTGSRDVKIQKAKVQGTNALLLAYIELYQLSLSSEDLCLKCFFFFSPHDSFSCQWIHNPQPCKGSTMSQMPVH